MNKDINKGGPRVRGDERGGDANEESSARRQEAKGGNTIRGVDEDNGCSRERERERERVV